ncbi:MAG: type II toxin-antitoxin system RelE/ParE family toxin [Ignavibacteriae bacterium]|nr:type II toxin-antitoxin system RelE/ParE family toxin [Ignavibacteriota bacterium]
MASKIRWSPRAISNLEHIYKYIATDSEYYASSFIRRLLSIIRAILSFPFAGRIVPEYSDYFLREKIFKNYRIVYRVKEPLIEIVAICHCSKPLEEIL